MKRFIAFAALAAVLLPGLPVLAASRDATLPEKVRADGGDFMF